MTKALIRKDLMKDGLSIPTRDGYIPQELIKEEFEAIQPDLLDDDEYNTILVYKDNNGETHTFMVNSIDLDFV